MKNFWSGRFLTFSEYGMGTKWNNQIIYPRTRNFKHDIKEKRIILKLEKFTHMYTNNGRLAFK